MNSVAVEPPTQAGSWSRLRWFVCISIAFAAHLGLIFAFGNRKPVVPRAVVNAPTIQFTTGRSERQLLDDPTLFALPHAHGFAARSWLNLPQVEFAPFRWSEPPRLLQLRSLPLTQLGNALLHYTQSNAVPRLELGILPPPELTRLTSADPTTSLKERSVARVSRELASRHWLNQPAALRSWPATDLLTNSVVRVTVDPDGRVFSPALLPPGSGVKTADQMALDLARSARFSPVSGGGKPVFGWMIFEWHTVPLVETNQPASP